MKYEEVVKGRYWTEDCDLMAIALAEGRAVEPELHDLRERLLLAVAAIRSERRFKKAAQEKGAQTTADGVVLRGGDTLYLMVAGHIVEFDYMIPRARPRTPCTASRAAGECYSTREAAEAAQGKD